MTQLTQTNTSIGNMKYIITESQLRLLSEEDIPLWLRRRLNAGALGEYIREEVQHQQPSDYSDEFEYADNIIMHAVSSFLTIDEDFFENDSFDEWNDRLTEMAKEEYGEELFEIYRANTNDDEFEDEEYEDD
jgi:hypothetical protein